MASDGTNFLATKFHCVVCGAIWGEGPDIGSAGFCIDCLAKWARTKVECFKLDMTNDNCNCCRFFRYCKG